jgi:photosystem I subunit 11
MAHGYFLVGPWTLLGPLRDSDHAYLGALIAALALILVATVALSSYGSVTFQSGDSSTDALQTADGWSQFASGFFVGASGGACVAYFLLENLNVVDGIFRGGFN